MILQERGHLVFLLQIRRTQRRRPGPGRTFLERGVREVSSTWLGYYNVFAVATGVRRGLDSA